MCPRRSYDRTVYWCGHFVRSCGFSFLAYVLVGANRDHHGYLFLLIYRLFTSDLISLHLVFGSGCASCCRRLRLLYNCTRQNYSNTHQQKRGEYKMRCIKNGNVCLRTTINACHSGITCVQKQTGQRRPRDALGCTLWHIVVPRICAQIRNKSRVSCDLLCIHCDIHKATVPATFSVSAWKKRPVGVSSITFASSSFSNPRINEAGSTAGSARPNLCANRRAAFSINTVQ